ITALAHGCQVLSTGFPLYGPLDSLIYRDADELAGDLAAGKARLSGTSRGMLADLIERHASPGRAAEQFIKAVRVAAARDRGVPGHPLFCVHGTRSSVDLHKLAGRLGVISVRSPLSQKAWNCPLRFDLVENRLEVLVAEKLMT